MGRRRQLLWTAVLVLAGTAAAWPVRDAAAAAAAGGELTLPSAPADGPGNGTLPCSAADGDPTACAALGCGLCCDTGACAAHPPAGCALFVENGARCTGNQQPTPSPSPNSGRWVAATILGIILLPIIAFIILFCCMGLWSLHTTRQQRKRLRPADAPPPPQPPRLVAWMLGRPYVPQAQRNAAAAAAAASRRNPAMAEPPPAYVPDEGTPPAYAFVLDSYTAPIGRGTPAPYYAELFPMAAAAGPPPPPPADAAAAAAPAGTSVPMPASPVPAVTVAPADVRRPTPAP